MIGHNQIITARKNGMKPSCIFIRYGFDMPTYRTETANPENALELGLYPFVWVKHGEIADVRFLTGCLIHATGKEWSDEFYAFLDKITKIQPSRIMACSTENDALMRWTNNEWEAHE